MIEPFYFDRARMLSLADGMAGAYAANSPFPHAVIDEFLPEPVIDSVLAEFPSPADLDWIRYDDNRQLKMATEDSALMPPFIRHLLGEFNSSVFVEFLERLTGINGLIADPHFRGGGMHMIGPGGFLGIHADFNRHERLRLDRRLNVLLYLNRDWDDRWGGALQLWDRDMRECRRAIEPVANRCVVFSTTDTSFHGHPDPLRCPVGHARRSLALYYYSNGRPSSEISASRTTRFVPRPGSDLDRPLSRDRLTTAATRWLPPVLVDGIRKLRHRG